jgi:hypothetical protein
MLNISLRDSTMLLRWNFVPSGTSTSQPELNEYSKIQNTKNVH